MQTIDNRIAIQPQPSIPWNEGNTETKEIRTQYPVHMLRCHLKGNLVVSGGTAVANGNGGGALNLINRISVELDSKDNPISYEGWMAGFISSMYSNNPNLTEGIAYTAGTHAFDVYFDIPINLGPGATTLLDPTKYSNMSVKTHWGSPSDVASGGGATVTVTGVQLDYDLVGFAGYEPGSKGGINGGYPLHQIDVRKIDIATANTKKIEELINGTGYYRFGFIALNDGNLSDGILNKMGISIGTSTPQSIGSAKALQARNASQYGFGSRQTGKYIWDLANESVNRSPIPSQLIGAGRDTVFNLELDVNNPSGTNELHMISFRLSSQNATNIIK